MCVQNKQDSAFVTRKMHVQNKLAATLTTRNRRVQNKREAASKSSCSLVYLANCIKFLQTADF